MKYIFITGGVTSSLGKGIVSASVAALLQARGYSVRIKKMDPYLNVDPGTMSPFQHGEVFVTEDGAETDLDLGHYERFTSNNANKNDSISAGRIYFNVIEKERRGDYLGSTIQVIPHVTNEIKSFIDRDINKEDFLICEIGGTVGDMEATPFLEAIRQFANEKNKQDILFIHLTLIPYLETTGELKTKPTQHSVRELQSAGIAPNIILCRSEHPISDSEKNKIAMFCNVSVQDVIPGYNADNIYKVPIAYHNEHLDARILHHFNLPNKNINLSNWIDIGKRLDNYQDTVNIALIGKYISLKDAYKSIVEALTHSGLHHYLKINIKWIDSEIFETDNISCEEIFKDIDGILVAPGFGERGISGKIKAVQYAREHDIPFLGICLGMQMAIIEICRNILNIKDATSSEFSNQGTHVIALITEWMKDEQIEKRTKTSNLGGTMRLGSYPCVLKNISLAQKIYNSSLINERHRHRFEVNINFKERLEEVGVSFSGMSPDNLLAEIMELTNHRWFVGVQFHPELKSKIFSPHPLFNSYIEAASQYKKDKKI